MPGRYYGDETYRTYLEKGKIPIQDATWVDRSQVPGRGPGNFDIEVRLCGEQAVEMAECETCYVANCMMEHAQMDTRACVRRMHRQMHTHMHQPTHACTHAHFHIPTLVTPTPAPYAGELHSHSCNSSARMPQACAFPSAICGAG